MRNHNASPAGFKPGPGEPAHAPSGASDPNPWATHAAALAAWVNKNLVNRVDAWGGYFRNAEGITRQTTRKAEDQVGAKGKESPRGPLSLADLQAHFAAKPDATTGLHSTVIDENGECWSRWFAVDIDRHGDDGNPEVNLRYALGLYGVLLALGFKPLLLDSNGAGGFHLLVVFDSPVPTRLVFAFAQWMIRDWESHGLDKAPETFPKQPGIGPGKFGNWLRLFGKHHTREHYTRLWDGFSWLEGSDAIKAILSSRGSPSTLIPAEARPDPNAPFDLGRDIERKRAQGEAADLGQKAKRSKADDGTTEPGEDFNNRASWQSILGPHGWVLDHESEGTGFWRRPGKTTGVSATTNHSGFDTLYVFTDATVFKQSGSYSKFGAFTVLEYNGDFTAAARSLAQQGYGSYAALVEKDGKCVREIRPNPRPKVEISWGKADRTAEAEAEGDPQEEPEDVDNTDGQTELDGEGQATAEPETERPLSPTDRVRGYIASDNFAGLLRDNDLLVDLASLEADQAGELAAIRAELKRARGISIRDFNAAVKAHRPIRKRTEGETGPPATAPIYRNAGRRFVLDLPGKDGTPESVQLCNFFARIVEEVVRDNGDDRATRFLIEGTRCDGAELAAEVPSGEFESMTWVVDQFGAKSIITAGRAMKDHTRAAIQTFSTNAIRRDVFTHTGWRKLAGEWKYLHGGGAMGAKGLDKSVTVDLVTEHKLAAYELPTPPDGSELKRAIRASLGILRLGMDDRPRSRIVAAVTLALPYRAAISRTNYAIQFNGPTGSHKSCQAALAQQHYGPAMGYNFLPAAWNGTVNALQALRHALKDALLTIDDYVPGGSHREREKLDKTAEDVFRSQGNGQGRKRMGPDGKLRPPMDPRGSLLSTGEDRVSRASANLRTLGIWFDKDDEARGATGTIDKEILTSCQSDADAGLYAASMAGFVRWLAPRYEAVRDALPVKALELRQLATHPGDHARTPDIVADLASGFEVFLEFATDSGAITVKEADRHRRTVWDGLMDAAAEMRADHQDGVDPADLFVQLIGGALSSNRAFLVDSKTGGDPDGFESACGWRKELKWTGNECGQVPMWVTGANAQKIGWTDGDLVYLEPTASYNAAQQMLRDRGETLPAPETLRRMLFSAGKLARTDSRNSAEGKGRLTARATLEKHQRNVLVILASEFWGVQEVDSITIAGEVEVEV